MRYYRVDLVDVIAGRTHYTPALLLALIENLPEDSATIAAARGGPEWRGWTKHVQVLADVYDAVNVNTAATGQWRKKPPKIPPYPRPKTGRSRVTKITDLKRRFGGAPSDREVTGDGEGAIGGPGIGTGDTGHERI